MFDVVSCLLTVSFFAADFEREDTDQFKVSIVPWDAEVNGAESDETEWERRTDAIWRRLSDLLEDTLRDPNIVPTFERLRSRGYRFALFKPDEKRDDWHDLTRIHA
jgi:hypothetical protein